MRMLKQELRKEFRAKRSALTLAEKNKLDDLLLIQFQKVDLPFLHTVLSYWPIEENNEPNTHLFTGFLSFRNPALELAFPKVNRGEKTMEAVLVNEDTAFQKGQFNVPEPISDHIATPESFDMVFVPLLICDLQGYRVGYGKGFYDKFLKHCRKDCIRIGFMYFEPVAEITDREHFDVPLDICITPQNIYVF
jgi:5-formyltetrahydrofolate cyclo-ligase